MAQGFTKGIPISTDPTMSANSDLVVPSQAAIVAYVNSVIPLTGVTSVGAISPVSSSGGTTPTISMPAANAVQSGFLTTTDWNTFNNKQDTLIAGTGISIVGTTISATGGGGGGGFDPKLTLAYIATF